MALLTILLIFTQLSGWLNTRLHIRNKRESSKVALRDEVLDEAFLSMTLKFIVFKNLRIQKGTKLTTTTKKFFYRQSVALLMVTMDAVI